MKILVVGEPARFDESRLKFRDHVLQHAQTHFEASKVLSDCDVVFDFIIDRHPDQILHYATKPIAVFLNTAMVTLASLTRSFAGQLRCTTIGFNGFPTLLNRQYLEVCILNKKDIAALDHLCNRLNTEYQLVDDRVGLVTPRVICMIINEAFYTVQEKTATREDIDLAMKLGTNYPHGPFGWCEKIGLKYVYELLDALYDDTRDQRYKISALMKKEYLALGPGH